MHRRALLGAVGTGVAGLAGCRTTAVTGDSGGTATPPTCDGPVPRRVSLVDTGDITAVDGLAVSATVPRARSDAEEPARLRTTVENAGDEPRELNVHEDDRCHLFDRDGRSEPRGLRLYHPDDTPTDRAGECWTSDAVPPDSVEDPLYGCTTAELGPGESLTTTYEVWDDYTADGYLPTDTYRIATGFKIRANGDDAARATDPGRPFERVEWWLDLRVEQPSDGE
ncbi:hypothetical protein [Halosimplex halophilum]|uniref:hypothetical protein n=1 Tax=Halosimplex halophilum TaxID=2559572 RepID=UPI00107EFA3F|nr:hypothetical protein [Halosimplex halophilum]